MNFADSPIRLAPDLCPCYYSPRLFQGADFARGRGTIRNLKAFASWLDRFDFESVGQVIYL